MRRETAVALLKMFRAEIIKMVNSLEGRYQTRIGDSDGDGVILLVKIFVDDSEQTTLGE